MSMKQKGLGRGLDVLFKGGRELEQETEPQKLPLAALLPNPAQPRRHFAEGALEDLAASIRSQGVLQPILVRPVGGSIPPRYEIVAGERRWRAAKIAGLVEIPALVRELSDQETLAVALIENLQREGLNPLEEARGFLQLKEQFGLSQEDLAQKLGKSRSSIANSLRLMNLSETARQDLALGRLSAGHARALLAVPDPEDQESLRQKIVAEGLSVRDAEALAASFKESRPSGEEAEFAGPEKKHSQPGKPKPQSALLMDWQDKVNQATGITVKISGKETKGRISLCYASKEEFLRLLSRLGVEGVAR